MLPFWLGEIELILDAGGDEPPAFGRLEADELRVAIITRDRAFPARELLGRVEAEGRRVARTVPGPAARTTRRRSAGTRLAGDMSVRDIAERLIVGHAEGHVSQLRETVAAAVGRGLRADLGLARDADLELGAELLGAPVRRPDRSDSTVRSRPDSSSWSAAALVPPGDVTMLRSCAGCMPAAREDVLPSSVSITRSWAMWRGKPGGRPHR